jgi:hypothetical protein
MMYIVHSKYGTYYTVILLNVANVVNLASHIGTEEGATEYDLSVVLDFFLGFIQYTQ